MKGYLLIKYWRFAEKSPFFVPNMEAEELLEEIRKEIKEVNNLDKIEVYSLNIENEKNTQEIEKLFWVKRTGEDTFKEWNPKGKKKDEEAL